MTYRSADSITVLSRGYKDLLIQRGVPSDKATVIFNWCDEDSIKVTERDAAVGVKQELQGKFNIIYAGAIGRVQALDSLVEAACLIQNELPKVQVVLIGDGVDLVRLKNLVGNLGIRNVRFIPRVLSSEISEFLACADALVIHLRADALGKVTIPQKTQAYLAMGKPIIMAVSGEAAEFVKKAEAGLLCTPENAESIASAMRLMFALPKYVREGMGANGRRFYKSHFSFEGGLSSYIKVYGISA
jgi:glycosyltransferase involved in cell wall biosynthesis